MEYRSVSIRDWMKVSVPGSAGASPGFMSPW
jgi:hypothetical protein